ncbi:serine protease 40-like [Saccopteryx bilineata]|uniref:serine protease 40-like n=1 Tax=Saccopteryx bilineata TaxID=59482 RepID=UPI00338E9BF7
MASTGAGGVGLGWQAAYALAIGLLWQCLLMPQAQPAPGTTEAVCGKPTVTGKIFGGRDAPVKKWPWQVSLFFHGSHICGGSLIDTFWVISAAHCFRSSRKPSDFTVLLGYHKLSQPTQHSLQRSVYRIIIHEDFNKQYFLAKDIALLQLHLSVTFNSYILPACLPGPDAILPLYTACWLTGWGMVTEDEFLKPPSQLQEAEVGVMGSSSCNLYFQSPNSMDSKYSVHEDMLCAGNLLSGKSLCRKKPSILNNSGDNRLRSSRALVISQTFPLLLVSFRGL